MTIIPKAERNFDPGLGSMTSLAYGISITAASASGSSFNSFLINWSWSLNSGGTTSKNETKNLSCTLPQPWCKIKSTWNSSKKSSPSRISFSSRADVCRQDRAQLEPQSHCMTAGLGSICWFWWYRFSTWRRTHMVSSLQAFDTSQPPGCLVGLLALNGIHLSRYHPKNSSCLLPMARLQVVWTNPSRFSGRSWQMSILTFSSRVCLKKATWKCPANSGIRSLSKSPYSS